MGKEDILSISSLSSQGRPTNVGKAIRNYPYFDGAFMFIPSIVANLRMVDPIDRPSKPFEGNHGSGLCQSASASGAEKRICRVGSMDGNMVQPSRAKEPQDPEMLHYNGYQWILVSIGSWILLAYGFRALESQHKAHMPLVDHCLASRSRNGCCFPQLPGPN